MDPQFLLCYAKSLVLQLIFYGAAMHQIVHKSTDFMLYCLLYSNTLISISSFQLCPLFNGIITCYVPIPYLTFLQMHFTIDFVMNFVFVSRVDVDLAPYQFCSFDEWSISIFHFFLRKIPDGYFMVIFCCTSCSQALIDVFGVYIHELHQILH